MACNKVNCCGLYIQVVDINIIKQFECWYKESYVQCCQIKFKDDEGNFRYDYYFFKFKLDVQLMQVMRFKIYFIKN